MAQHWTENTRALKILIAVMTVLLIAGLTALVYGMVRTARQMSAKDTAHTETVATRTGSDGIIDADLPPGAEIVDMALSGHLILLRLRIHGIEHLLTLDARTGERKGFLRLRPH